MEAEQRRFDDWLDGMGSRSFAEQALTEANQATASWKRLVEDLARPRLATLTATSLSDQVLASLPSALDSSTADLIRSLNWEPVQQAAKEVADWLERLREEAGEAESLDEVEERLGSERLAVLREALVTALAELVSGTREAGVTVWVALNAFLATLSPAGRILLEVVLGALLQDGIQRAFPVESALPSPAEQPTPAAAPADPAHRTSEILVANRNVRVYIEAQPKARVLAVVPARRFMRVEGRRVGWYLISYAPADGDGVRVQGWVKARGLKPADAETARLVWCALTAEPRRKHCSE